MDSPRHNYYQDMVERYNLIYLAEVKFEERLDGDDALVSIDRNNPTLMLEVGFDSTYSGDIVWLHGVVVLDYEYEVDTDIDEIPREVENAGITIVIQKVTSLRENPRPIYTMEVDLLPGCDDVSIPFSHIDVETEPNTSVKYRVLVFSDCLCEEDVDIEGPNTLVAIRFTRRIN